MTPRLLRNPNVRIEKDYEEWEGGPREVRLRTVFGNATSEDG